MRTVSERRCSAGLLTGPGVQLRPKGLGSSTWSLIQAAKSADDFGNGWTHERHPDPFDRMLVAQAQLESLVLVTADTALDR